MSRRHGAVTPEELGAAADPDALLEKYVVAALVGVSYRTIERWTHEGRFPAPIYLNPQMKRWRARQVRQWLQAASSIGVSETAAIAGADSVSSESR